MNIEKLPKEYITEICEISQEETHKLLKSAIAIINPNQVDKTKAIDKVSLACSLSKSKTYELLGVFLTILRFFVESTEKDFNSKLADLGFTVDFIKKLPLENNRNDITEAFSHIRKTNFLRISALKWRTDISLTSSSLQKKVPVTVIFSVTLSNGRIVTIEVDGLAFNKLRFTISLLLKELSNAKSNFVK